MTGKKNLVYILHDIEIGGAEVALLSAIPSLCEQFNLTIIVLGHVDEDLVKKLLSVEKSPFHVFDYSLYLFPFKINEIVEYILGLHPDKVVCSLWRACWIGVVLKKRLRSINLFAFIHSTHFFHLFDAIFSRRVMKVADKILVDSNSSFQFVRSIVNADSDIITISFLTNKTPEPTGSFRKRWYHEDRPIKFLFLGRIARVKNLPIAIKLVDELRKNSYQIILHIYGPFDNDYNACYNMIKKKNLENYIIFKGEVHPSDRFFILKQYDFLIQLSEHEGMAMSVAEAMQNGLVSIVTPVGEILNYAKDGESAIFVDYSTRESWSASLQKVKETIDDPDIYEKMSQNSIRSFLNKPSYSDSLISTLKRF